MIKTHRGYFKYQRLPFGIKTTPALFQGYISEVLRDEKGVLCYMDDLIIYSKNATEFKERVNKILQILWDNDLRLNEKK